MNRIPTTTTATTGIATQTGLEAESKKPIRVTGNSDATSQTVQVRTGGERDNVRNENQLHHIEPQNLPPHYKAESSGAANLEPTIEPKARETTATPINRAISPTKDALIKTFGEVNDAEIRTVRHKKDSHPLKTLGLFLVSPILFLIKAFSHRTSEKTEANLKAAAETLTRFEAEMKPKVEKMLTKGFVELALAGDDSLSKSPDTMVQALANSSREGLRDLTDPATVIAEPGSKMRTKVIDEALDRLVLAALLEERDKKDAIISAIHDDSTVPMARILATVRPSAQLHAVKEYRKLSQQSSNGVQSKFDEAVTKVAKPLTEAGATAAKKFAEFQEATSKAAAANLAEITEGLQAKAGEIGGELAKESPTIINSLVGLAKEGLGALAKDFHKAGAAQGASHVPTKAALTL